MYPAQDQTGSAAEPATRRIPGPEELPGIEGFYVLTGRGELGRYDLDGVFRPEPALTATLSDMVHRFLHAYRSGDASRLALGLVSNTVVPRPWRSATLVLADAALRAIYRTGNDTNAPLTAFQRRNRLKSVFQGMELLLDTRKASQPQYPRFCPLLFAPEASSETLGRRYGIDYVDARRTLEVLDFTALFTPEEKRRPALSRMVIDMRRAQIAPEVRHEPGLTLVEDTPPPDPGTAADSGRSPWQDEPEPRDACFNDGDPVTYWLLGWFAPFDQLNDLQRQFIARGHTVTKRSPGATLIEQGSRDDVSIYLIQGTLELEAFDGRRTTVTGGTRRARLPISQLRPHAYTVTAVTEVTFTLFSQETVRELTRVAGAGRDESGIELSEGAGGEAGIRVS